MFDFSSFLKLLIYNFKDCHCDEELVNIKIIEEPVITSLGGGNANNVLNVYNRHLQDDDALSTKATHYSANFSGPSHLNQLDGKCFNYLSSK